MTTEPAHKSCKACGHPLTGPYCAQCGHPAQVKRINGNYLLQQIASVLNFQKGILFTIRELLIRPGKTVAYFIHGNRKQLVSPIGFVILCSLIYLIIRNIGGFEDGYMNVPGFKWGGAATAWLLQWIRNNYGFANILMATFMALWLKLFFRRSDYNLFEVLVLLYFILGIQMLVLALFGIVEAVTQLKVLDKASLLSFIYICWSITQFFQGKKLINFLKAFFSYCFGMISFLVFMILLGVLIDLILS